MTVALDGSTVNSVTLTNKDAQYAVNVKIAAGAHTIAVAYTNDYKTFLCDRNLLLDSVVVVPAATQPPPTTTTTPPPAQRAGFVYRSGATMMLNGSPYRFVGVNSYDFTGCHTGQPLSASDADKFFAQLPPNSMARVWAFEPWGIDAITQTVRLAEARNQKLTLVFADGGGHCSEPTYDAAWYAQGF